MTQEEFDFLLEDRKQKIAQIHAEYNLIDNSFISFSGGKDSLILSHLVDLALPGNQIPRIYVNTGIEYTMQVNFVKKLKEADERIYIIQPTKNVRETLETVGYPFKSKYHSHMMNTLGNSGMTESLKKYFYPAKNTPHSCPQILQYQATEKLPFKVSDRCCYEFKKKPFHFYSKKSGRMIAITGIRGAEGGMREKAGCLSFEHGKLRRFNPLQPLSDDFCDFFVNQFDIKLSPLYYAPYNFKRTGCRGCPLNVHLRDDLQQMALYAPNEFKACNLLWQPVYDEYKRIGYRIKSKSFLVQEEFAIE